MGTLSDQERSNRAEQLRAMPARKAVGQYNPNNDGPPLPRRCRAEGGDLGDEKERKQVPGWWLASQASPLLTT